MAFHFCRGSRRGYHASMGIKELTDFVTFFGPVIAAVTDVWNLLLRRMLRSKRVWRISILVTWLGLQTVQPTWGFGTSTTPAVQLLVGYPPGGLADRLSRLAAVHLSRCPTGRLQQCARPAGVWTRGHDVLHAVCDRGTSI